MFILLWMYLGGLISVLISVVEVAIIRHYNLCKMVPVILVSLAWPIAYLADLISKIRYAIRRKQN